MNQTSLDLGYVEARPILPFQTKNIRLLMVGLGGTGSFLARHVACLALLLREAGKEVSLVLIDPDIVEAKNLPRQNFCPADIGHYKAEALASRYSRDLGLEITVCPLPFSPNMVPWEWDTLTVVIGCVDSASARLAMNQALEGNDRYLRDKNALPRTWHLDAGNGKDYGQVLLGCTSNYESLASAFTRGAISCCSLLPSPLLQEPKLREPKPEELNEQALSCADLLIANAQAMTINPAMAIEAADYLYRLLITGDLKRFATYRDLPAGTTRSSYTSPAGLAKTLQCSPTFFTRHASELVHA